MSVVSNVMLTGLGCGVVAKRLNSWLNDEKAERNFGELRQVDKHAGGRKAMETDVFMGAFNYLPDAEFIAAYRALALPGVLRTLGGLSNVQLFLCRQDDNTFQEIPQKDDNVDYAYRTRENDSIRTTG